MLFPQHDDLGDPGAKHDGRKAVGIGYGVRLVRMAAGAREWMRPYGSAAGVMATLPPTELQTRIEKPGYISAQGDGPTGRFPWNCINFSDTSHNNLITIRSFGKNDGATGGGVATRLPQARRRLCVPLSRVAADTGDRPGRVNWKARVDWKTVRSGCRRRRRPAGHLPGPCPCAP